MSKTSAEVQPAPSPLGLDFSWTPDLIALREEAVEVARGAVADAEYRENSWIHGFSREFSKELGRRGWLGMTWPREAGGGGRTPLERFVVTEALIAHGAPIAAAWLTDRQMGPTIIQFGTRAQRQRFLPAMLSGESTWCIGMSEPDAGSDLASLSTRAVLDGNHFVVTGAKVWTSFAAEADHCYLVCRTDTNAPAHRGLSELIVDMRSPGVSVVPIVDMTGDKHFCEIVFDDVRVPVENVVGEINNSWRQLMRQLEHERGGIDRLVSNWSLYQDSLARADTEDAVVRQQIARIETGYHIGRLLVLKEVLGQGKPSFSAVTKVACTALEQRVADFCSYVDGPASTLWSRTARGVCWAPAYTIQGGTDNVLRNVVGDRILGLPREPRTERGATSTARGRADRKVSL